MFKQVSVASVVLIGIGFGAHALIARSAVRSVPACGQTTSPAAAARKWLQEHGYRDENATPAPRARRGSHQP
jgi:hypothetical protein